MRPAIPAVLILACALPASAADPAAGVIRVTATYPGADARTVDETVLTPLFQQINGIEGATRIESEARNDGTGTLTVYFEPEADLNLAQVLVQNRASLALPVIPAPCREIGMPVRKLPAGPPAFWLALTSSDVNHDARWLENYANTFLKNELARVRGVADVRVVGAGELDVQVRLDMERLRAYALGVRDVVGALRQQNARVAGGTIGAGPYPFTASGRLVKPEEFADVILKANPDGEILRLKDVAKVEFGATTAGFARVDGKPAALIAVTAWPGRATAERLRKIEAAGDLPPGMRFDVVADRTAGRLLEVEVRTPPGSTRDYTEGVVERATGLIHELPGTTSTVALAEGRAPDAAVILVKVRAKGGPTAADVEKALAAIPSASIRVGAVPPGGEAFPVRLALTDPGDRGEEPFREVADDVVARLKKDTGVTGVAAFPGPPTPHYALDVDRDKCAMRGLKLTDVFTTIQAAGSGIHATDFRKFGRTFRVTVQAEPRFARHLEDLENLFVRNDNGEMVPLGAIVKTRKALAPPAVVRVNGYRAIIVTANPAAGKTPAETAARCVKLAEEVLPGGYRVKDVTGLPR